jgi:hypothetical protein
MSLKISCSLRISLNRLKWISQYQSVDNAALLRRSRKHETIVRMERGIGEFVLHDTTLASLALEALPGTDVAADWQNRPRRIGGLVSLKATGACDLCSVSRHRFRPRGQLKDASLFPVAIPNHSGETAAASSSAAFPRHSFRGNRLSVFQY